MKITFIGSGNIGGATAIGLATHGAVKGSDITVTSRHETKLRKFAKYGINTTTDNIRPQARPTSFSLPSNRGRWRTYSVPSARRSTSAASS